MAMKSSKERRKSRVVSAERRLAEHTSGFDKLAIKVPSGVNVFKAEKDKTYRLSIVPFEAGKGNPFAAEHDYYYERTYYTHPRVGPNGDTVICSAKVFKKPCAVCDFRGSLAADPNPDVETKATIKSLWPKERQVWLVYDHDDPKKGVQLFEVSNFCFGKALDAKINRARPEEKAKMKTFADPDKGMILNVGVTQKTTGAFPFLDYSDIEFKARKEPLPDIVLDAAICLDELIKEPKFKDIKKLIETGGAEADDDEDDADTKTEDEDDEQGEEKDDGDDEEGENEDEEGDSEDGDEDEESDDDSERDEDADDGADDDSEEDEDLDDEDEEIEAGDTVTILLNGKRKKAKVLKVVGDKARIKVVGKEESIKVALDDLTKFVAEEEEEKPKPSSKKPSKKPKGDDAPW